MKILICPPTYFRIAYEINPWMHIENNSNTEIILSQYDKLKEKLTWAGIDFVEFKPVEAYPDMVYTANYGVVLPDKKLFIVANFKYIERQGESILAINYFKALGYTIVELPSTIYFEGEGDFLYGKNNKWYMGYGKRSMLEAATLLQKHFDEQIVSLELINPYYYHLDTCFAPLNENTVIINPKSFTRDGLEIIYNDYKNVVEGSEQDHQYICCNMLANDNKYIVAEGVSIEFIKKLNNIGYEVFTTPMSEYIKGGGSVKCCSLKFNSKD